MLSPSLPPAGLGRQIRRPGCAVTPPPWRRNPQSPLPAASAAGATATRAVLLRHQRRQARHQVQRLQHDVRGDLLHQRLRIARTRRSNMATVEPGSDDPPGTAAENQGVDAGRSGQTPGYHPAACVAVGQRPVAGLQPGHAADIGSPRRPGYRNCDWLHESLARSAWSSSISFRPSRYFR